jgi:iron complex outermembrane recepter protein
MGHTATPFLPFSPKLTSIITHHRRIAAALFALIVFGAFVSPVAAQPTTPEGKPQEVKPQESLKDVFSQFSLQDLLNVSIVTVSKKAETVFDAPLASSVLTGDEIKKAGATSVMDALRLVPGIIVREQTPGNFDIHIRGFDAIDPFATMLNAINTITLVMINNRIVYNDSQGGTLWEVLQVGVDDIDKIEVVRGPASALYGPNAASGVINILTKKPFDAKPGFHASTYSQGGNFGTILANGTIGFSQGLQGWAFRAGGSVDMRNRHLVDFYRFGTGNPFDNGTIVVPSGYRSLPDELANGRYFDTLNSVPPGLAQFFITQRVAQGNPFPSPNRYFPSVYPDISQATSRYNFNTHLGYKNAFGELNILGGYASSQVMRPYTAITSYALTTEKNTAGFVQMFGRYKSWSFETDFNRGINSTVGLVEYVFNALNATTDYSLNLSDNFNLKPGVAYRYSLFDPPTSQSGSSITGIGRRSENYTASTFLRAEYFVKRFRLIGALRYDFFRVPGRGLLSPQLISTLKPNDDLIIRASYGRAGRSPFMQSLFGDISESAGFPARIRANRNYQFLIADDFEAGVKFNLGKNVSLDLEGFYTLTKNYESLVFKGTDISTVDNRSTISLLTFENTSQRVNQFGGTFTLTVVPVSNLRLQAFVTVQQTRISNYNYSNPTDPANQPEIARPFFTGRSVRDSSFTHAATPPYFGGFTINYVPIAKLNLNLNAYFYGAQTFSVTNVEASDFQTRNTFEIPANLLLNGTVNYEIVNGLTVFANARQFVGGGKRQFGFADRIDAMFLGGVTMKF